MKAFAISSYGAHLGKIDLPEPEPGQGEVLVAIDAAGVNPIDERVRSGDFKRLLPMEMPLVLGQDFAGTVIRAGSGATRFEVGDRVFGCTGSDYIGTFAERIAVPEASITAVPSSIGQSEAAALPLVSLTAWQVLVGRARLKRGQKILIHAGSGGVGTTAIQLAKHLGATVATTVSTANVAMARELGADVVIDYMKEAFEKRLSGYDVVLTTLGPDVLEKSLQVLKPGGRLISLSGPPDPDFARKIGANILVRTVIWFASLGFRRKARRAGVDYAFHFMHADGGQLAQISALVDEGAIRPVIDERYAFDSTPQALAHVADGHSQGKVVIELAHDERAT